MDEENNEKQYWIRFLNKYIFVEKSCGQLSFNYRGVVVDVLDDKIILDDEKSGKLPLVFKNLSVTGTKEDK